MLGVAMLSFNPSMFFGIFLRIFGNLKGLKWVGPLKEKFKVKVKALFLTEWI